MFNLDINFLNDRPDLKPDKKRSSGRSSSAVSMAPGDKRPMYVGAAAMLILPAIAGALWGGLSFRTGDLEKQQAELDSQLGNLEAEKKNLAKINAQIKEASDEIQALATVFNQIKPWSAMAQDIRDRLPGNIQLLNIKQVEVKEQPTSSASPAPGAEASRPAQNVEISGLASSFNDVNDFMLTLQQSNFLKSDVTRLIEAKLGKEETLPSLNLATPGEQGRGQTNQTIKPPKLPRQVEFKILAAMNEVPASELIRELDRKGAVGLVSRIEALKERGVVQETKKPATPTPEKTDKKEGAKP
jgi:type IV pilus assembly protein PilN